jgi:hypothetical protein
MSNVMSAAPSMAARSALASAWTSPVSTGVENPRPAGACYRFQPTRWPAAITRLAPIATPTNTAAVPSDPVAPFECLAHREPAAKQAAIGDDEATDGGKLSGVESVQPLGGRNRLDGHQRILGKRPVRPAV